ncbi:hypothetical protein DES53_115151 [Roseimicrobium gellanilyticum]|uniref:Uncharacterized protein n=1 Tax=Roseimicrobium gellanilyticum TaxID=748857 RepID=A0A366H7P5_9BACT|nr:hypothetical protein [Roseimicrobium gellanilyticum]RBP37010.1 hypothetical protein DES53_115151 [Roseimicrobium gellanilyticum]
MTWEAAAVYLAIGGLATSAVGVGMQYSAQKEAARNQEALARYNYAVQAQNIRQQQALAEWNARAQAGQAEANAAMARQAAEVNARNLEQQAQSVLLQGTEEQRRTREEHRRHMAIAFARVAKSGVAAAGSPIEVLAESARTMQLALNDAWYTTNTKREALLWDAKVERYGGEIGAANYSGQASLLRAEGALAPIKARMDLRSAKYESLAGLNAASGMRSAAGAGLVSGMGTLLQSGYTMAYQGGYLGTTKPAPSTSSTPKVA